MVLKLFYLFRLENHFAYSGIMGESIWQGDTPNTNPMGHWIRSVLLRSLGLSQHFSFFPWPCTTLREQAGSLYQEALALNCSMCSLLEPG